MQKRFLLIICLLSMMFLVNIGKVNAISLENVPTNMTIANTDVSNYFNVLAETTLDCGTYIDEALATEIRTIILMVQVAAIVVTIILGILEFAKATVSEDADLKKGASKRFLRRIFIMALILLVPAIVQFLLINFNIVTTNPLCNVAMIIMKGV